jgi:hypothetical protein
MAHKPLTGFRIFCQWCENCHIANLEEALKFVMLRMV